MFAGRLGRGWCCIAVQVRNERSAWGSCSSKAAVLGTARGDRVGLWAHRSIDGVKSRELQNRIRSLWKHF